MPREPGLGPAIAVRRSPVLDSVFRPTQGLRGPGSARGARQMVLLRERGTHFEEHTTQTGALRAWVLTPNVFVTQGEGHMTDEHCSFIVGYGEERIRQHDGKLYVFHDWLEMTGYDSRTRMRLTAWSVAHRQAYQEVHLAVRSRIIAMGVQVANVAVGGIMRAHTGIAALEVELARAMRLASGAMTSLRPPAAR